MFAAVVPFNGYLYFHGNDGVHGRELWRTDGTPGGTQMVADIRPGPEESFPSEFTMYQNRIYFKADDGVHGQELWATDGSTTGTVLVRDIEPGLGHANPRELFVVNGWLVFSTGNWNTAALWRTDGTTTVGIVPIPVELREAVDSPQLTRSH